MSDEELADSEFLGKLGKKRKKLVEKQRKRFS